MAFPVGALLGLLGSLGGAAIQANQPGPVSQAEQKSMGQANMPDPVPMQENIVMDWDRLLQSLNVPMIQPRYGNPYSFNPYGQYVPPPQNDPNALW